ncbi:MAG TPA: DUF2268 domain-containing putative Zn-dependent protease [Allosphingosinicella sp.]|nr:DUF2268 domain-containing putative Zn-dependent protease [Allosphingosinicella sp.]
MSFVPVAAILAALIFLPATPPGPVGGPVIRTEDVTRFFVVYDAAGGHPNAQQLQRDYLDKGSDGLHDFAKLRNITGARIADNLAMHPGVYEQARRCAAVLPQARRRELAALHRLRDVYPAAKFPPITVAIGRGKPAGVGSPVHGVMIGLEALCGVTYFDANLEDRFVHAIFHEYIHVQQVRALVDDEHPTVLEASLIEGAAEFMTELIAGGVSERGVWTKAAGREKEIEAAFIPDEDKKDVSAWLYNGTVDRPGDLGYWVGYRIVKAYYEHARDKRRAIREILEMNDPKAFLAKSGWHPGMKLGPAALPKPS